MSYQLASAYVSVEARMGSLEASFGKLEGQLHGFFGGFAQMSPLLETALGVGSLSLAVHEFTNAADQGYTAQSRLIGIIRATGNAARVSKDEILATSRALQEKGIFGSDEIALASARLLQMRAVTRETFPEVIKLSTDVAASGFGSVETAATMLGRALANPAQGLFRLRTIGVVFTREEQNKIEVLAKANDLFDAQQLILEKVRASVGGLNEEMAKTPQGQWKQIKNQLEDIAKEVGYAIYPVIVDIGHAIVDMSKAILPFVQAASEINRALGGWPAKLLVVGTLAYLSWGRFKAIYHTLVSLPGMVMTWAGALQRFLFGYLQPVSMGFVAIPGLIANIATAWDAFIASVISGEILTGWGAILVAIGAGILLIAGEIYAVYRYLKQFPAVTEAWAMFWDSIVVAAGEIWQAVKNIWGSMLTIAQNVLPEWVKQIPLIKALLEEGILPVLVRIIDKWAEMAVMAGAVIEVLSRHVGKLAEQMSKVMSGDILAIKEVVHEISATGNIPKEISDQFKKGWDAVRKSRDARMAGAGAGNNLLDSKSGLTGLQEAWKGVQESLLKREDPSERTAKGVESLEEIGNKQLEEQIKLTALLGGGTAVATA